MESKVLQTGRRVKRILEERVKEKTYGWKLEFRMQVLLHGK
jgi:hypothetical protein